MRAVPGHLADDRSRRTGDHDLVRTLRSALTIMTLAVGVGMVTPTISSADPHARSSLGKKSKKKPKPKKAEKAATKEAKVAPVDVRTLVTWFRAGIDSEEIIARARKAGYVANKRDQKKLAERHLPASLIATLSKAAPTESTPAEPTESDPAEDDSDEPKKAENASKNGKKKTEGIDLETIVDPNEIDFDSIPPPDGTPKQEAPRAAGSTAPSKSDVTKKPTQRSAQPRKPIVAASP